MIDAATFRRVLGNYPTGVCAITARADDGVHAAMIVGTFTSVSMDPPLVGFLPDKKSSSWPEIQRAGRFCVNVLGSDQRALCNQLSRPHAEKYVDVPFRLSEHRSPILEGVIAWIDCSLHSVIDAGDHYLVLGQIQTMEIEREGDPMLFFRGRYGGFSELEAIAHG